MEEFSQLGGNLWGGLMCASSPTPKACNTVMASMVAPPSSTSIFDKGHCIQNPLLLLEPTNQNPHLQTKLEGSTSSFQFLASDVDAIKAKIISHPQYSSLLAAYIDCQKVGAPPEVAARLSAVAQELEARHRASLICQESPTDPELDQFMEAYHDMLVKYKEELSRPLQEAMEFLRRVESQLNSLSLSNGTLRILSTDFNSGKTRCPTAVCQKAKYVHLYEENPFFHAKPRNERSPQASSPIIIC